MFNVSKAAKKRKENLDKISKRRNFHSKNL